MKIQERYTPKFVQSMGPLCYVVQFCYLLLYFELRAYDEGPPH